MFNLIINLKRKEDNFLKGNIMKPKTQQVSATFKENLKTKLTPSELTAYSTEMSEKYIEHGQLEADKKGVVADYKGKTDVLEGQLGQLSVKVSTQHEWRDVEVHWAYNFTTNKKLLIREDSGEIVKEDKVTDADRQKLFPIDLKKAGKKPNANSETK
jgi:hypothetical protein